MTELAQHFPVDVAGLRRLHARLERDAQTGNLLDIAYRTVDSAIGPLLLAATPARAIAGGIRQRRPRRRAAESVRAGQLADA